MCTTDVLTYEIFPDVRRELRTDFMMHDGVKRAIAEHADKTKKLHCTRECAMMRRYSPRSITDVYELMINGNRMNRVDGD